MKSMRQNLIANSSQIVPKKTSFVVFAIAALVVNMFSAAQVNAVVWTIPEIAQPFSLEEVTPPQNLRVVGSTNSTLEFAWDTELRSIFVYDASAYEAVSYEVELYDKATDVFMDSVTTTLPYVTFTELEANRAYRVHVRTEQNGMESETVTLVARTVPMSPLRLTAAVSTRQIRRDVITNEPIGFENNSGGKFVASLDWKKPDGKIRFYTVNVYRVGEEEPAQTLTRRSSNAEVVGLAKGEYEYTVTAHFNEEYMSATSERVQFTAKKRVR